MVLILLMVCLVSKDKRDMMVSMDMMVSKELNRMVCLVLMGRMDMMVYLDKMDRMASMDKRDMMVLMDMMVCLLVLDTKQ